MACLRSAGWRDLFYVRRVRNEVTASKWFIDSSGIGLWEHAAWWVTRQSRFERLFIIMEKGVRVGYLRVAMEPDKLTSISIALEPFARGLGIGSESVRRIMKTQPFPESVGWRAIVRADNFASVSMFMDVGFNAVLSSPSFGEFITLEVRNPNIDALPI